MGFADLHIHSTGSDGTATVEAILHHASRHTDLDVIAITDHDCIDTGLQALELAENYRIEVIPGVEITTREGHLLALFLHTPVKTGMSFVETAEQVRLAGGLPFAAHPCSTLAPSVRPSRLRYIANNYPGLLAGIESDNGSLPLLRENELAQKLRWELGLTGIGNSDAHVLSEIGSSRTLFAGQTASDLRLALEEGTVVPLPTKRAKLHLRRHAVRFALRYSVGLIQDLDSPRGNVRRIRWRRLG